MPDALDWRTGYLQQARADYEIFLHLSAQEGVPHCQKLHYLQMTTEKLAKGFLTPPGGGPYPKVHDAFVNFVLAAKHNPKIRAACKFNRYSAFNAYSTSLLPLASVIEGLSPEGGDHPNPEYPWEEQGRIMSPLTYPFPGLDFQNPHMIRLLSFIKACFTLF